ncbi:MAG: 6-phosphogluconolactonase [Melioribacteraceae bacterium]
MKNRKIKIFSNQEKLAKYFSEILIKKISKNTSNYNLSIALAGGSTPKKIFKYMADNYSGKINWEKTNFFFGDERCVPPNDAESNFKMVDDILFSPLQIPTNNIFRVKGENDPANEAKNYSNVIKKNVRLKKEVPRFDIVMLGIGEDGHTASIFPNQIELFHSKNICEVATHPESGQKRISLTGTVISNAKLIVFIATGKNKSKIVSELLNENKDKSNNYPASLVSSKKGKLVWLLDTESASLLY